MIIMGTVGAGKSVVVGRMIQYLAKKLTRCRWVSFRYFANLIEGHTVDADDSASAELYRFERYPILVLDDLCCEPIAPWQKKKLNHLLNERHENKKPTIYTTNCNDKDIVAELGSAMWSRISEDSQIVVMAGSDRRKK
jgi:DNA replication protein DnaC